MPFIDDAPTLPRTAEGVVPPPPARANLSDVSPLDAFGLLVLVALVIAAGYGLWRARHALRRGAVATAAFALWGTRKAAVKARSVGAEVRAKADRLP